MSGALSSMDFTINFPSCKLEHFSLPLAAGVLLRYPFRLDACAGEWKHMSITTKTDTSADASTLDEAGFDAHGIEPVPAAHRTSSPFDQFWIWTGANIAPI